MRPSAAPLHGAALAARLLESACAPGPSGDALRLEVVRGLARDLKRELEVLAARRATGAAALVESVEGALRAADVANLAASALAELPEARVPKAAAAAHLAAGATRALGALARTVAEDPEEEDRAPSALREARGADWRARLAVRQVDEFLGETG